MNAAGLAAQSRNTFAAGLISFLRTSPIASRSHPDLSDGNTSSTGDPRWRSAMTRASSETPTGYSPAAAMVAGLEPEWVYWAMLAWSRSRYAHPASSPRAWSTPMMMKYPVPLDDGLGIVTSPRSDGSARSSNDLGTPRFRRFNSGVFAANDGSCSVHHKQVGRYAAADQALP